MTEPCGAAPLPPPRPWSWLPGVLLALAFLLLGLVVHDDFAATWDEYEAHEGSKAAFERGFTSTLEQNGRHAIPGYYFPFDYGRGAFHHLVVERLGWTDWIGSQHLFHLGLASLALLLLYQTVLQLSGLVRPALWSALALATFPKFVGHSQSNPKDLPTLFAFLLGACLFTRFQVRKSWGSALLSGVAFGFAFSVREFAVVLPLLLGVWFAWMERGSLRPHLVKLASAALVAAATFVACWPWLWADPGGRLLQAFHFMRDIPFNVPVLYLGEVVRAKDMPWHYTLVLLAAATPLGHWIALGCSTLRPVDPAHRAGLGSVRRLGWIWCAALLLMDACGAVHYDSFRHVLVVLVGISLLAGLGVEALRERLKARLGPRPALLVPLGVFGLAGFGSWRTHPYQDAYLGEGVLPFVAGRGEEVFELEYWGAAYKEGAEWLNAHAEPDAKIYLAEVNITHRRYLQRPAKPLALEEFANTARPRYFMTITRKAFYDVLVAQVVRDYEPVFEVRRAEGVLLRIYRNDRRRQS